MNISFFLNALQNKLNERKQAIGLTYFDHYDVFATEGKKFFKVYRQEIHANSHKGPQHIVAFIDKVTGDIFKPASFNAPAKHSRGNVNSESHGMEAINEQGFVNYLR